MRTLAAVLLFSASCSGVDLVADPSPSQIVCRLETRDRVLTVYAADSPLRFAVHERAGQGGQPGRLVARGTDLRQLDQVDAKLARAFHDATAHGSALAN